MELKRFAVSEIKALPDGTGQPGEFEAMVSVFGNVDSVGDIVEKGAFTDSLSKGLPPIVWSHQWDVPPIGTTMSATETDQGLVIKGRLFVGEGEDSPMARAVYTAMKAKDGRGEPTLKEFSFGFCVTDAEYKTVDGEEIRSLKGIDLFEAGPCLKGVNPATQLLAVKSALEVDQKAGRVLSKANEDALKQAADLINTVVEQVAPAPKAVEQHVHVTAPAPPDARNIAKALTAALDRQAAPDFDLTPAEAKATTTSAPETAPKNDTPADPNVAPDLTPAPVASQEDRARIAGLLLAAPNDPTPQKEQ
jgi:HK97 family phage prohead protease